MYWFSCYAMLSILFICTNNAGRSQLAEAICNHEFADSFKALSAGARATQVSAELYQYFQQHELQASHQTSKALESLPAQKFDYVITLCSEAKQECLSLPESPGVLHWELPSTRDEQGQPRFDAIAALLRQQLKRLQTYIQQRPQSLEPLQVFKLLSDETRLQIMMLIEDEQRLSVNELCQALAESQPKTSRHLALLRESGLLSTTRHGQQIFYHLPDCHDAWVAKVLATTRIANPSLINLPLLRLRELRLQLANQES
ncbi:metalloregulator ArsR/SmtB family transcription factor [Aliagarivorans marinus]|uniref:metalloregulator ArsR/SmtB family transcription factor n=1 Tax=Aliagarivorans marinus TaxID=561965 RepID=UPI0003FD800E|nr:metalloregulator ArsR/SmtB family transcription factor [Aliagarivorans marinus]